MDYQKIILVGNATKDSEQKTSKDQEVKYTRFTIAVGERRGVRNFFPIVWG